MKKPILQNLVEMTGLRDHLRLEVSVLSTLQSISGITNIRALEIFAHDGETYLRPRTWLDQGQLLSSEMEGLHTNTRQPLSQYPALQECIDNQQISTMHSPRRGCHILWMPVWKNNRAGSCLEITQSRPFSLHRLEVILGIFQVYQNYQSLLDYSERDALTGLLNRKTFDEQLARNPRLPQVLPGGSDTETPSGNTHQQWLAVVDIGHFKQVNDRFGHLYGDEVLILLANLLRSSFRSHDKCFASAGRNLSSCCAMPPCRLHARCLTASVPRCRNTVFPRWAMSRSALALSVRHRARLWKFWARPIKRFTLPKKMAATKCATTTIW